MMFYLENYYFLDSTKNCCLSLFDIEATYHEKKLVGENRL